MLGGKGLYRGGSVLVSGTAGTGKTSLAASFANETCNRGERCVYFAMEESPNQIIRNMQSIGIDLQKHIDRACSTLTHQGQTYTGLKCIW
jgi:circadian clock protein KaiC